MGYTYKTSSTNTSLFTSAMNMTTECLFTAFHQMGCFVSSPSFKYRHDGDTGTVLITAYYYARPSTTVNPDLLGKVHATLSNVFASLGMHIELSLVKVHTPLFNASILSQ